MASEYHGKTCNATWDSEIAAVLGWSVTVECSTAESTARHDTKTGRTREVGTYRASATVTARANGDFSPAAGDSSTLVLERGVATANKGYKGTATCTGATRTVTKDDVDAVEYSFTFNGTVSNDLS